MFAANPTVDVVLGRLELTLTRAACLNLSGNAATDVPAGFDCADLILLLCWFLKTGRKQRDIENDGCSHKEPIFIIPIPTYNKTVAIIRTKRLIEKRKWQ
jgi:hypothetical protein